MTGVEEREERDGGMCLRRVVMRGQPEDQDTLSRPADTAVNHASLSTMRVDMLPAHTHKDSDVCVCVACVSLCARERAYVCLWHEVTTRPRQYILYTGM